MQTEEEFKAKIKEQEELIKSLKQKLEKRDTAFTKNLNRKAFNLLTKMKADIGVAVKNAVGDQAFNELQGKTFRVWSNYSSYGGTSYGVTFEKNESDKDLIQFFENKQMAEFQSSLDNFAWAVQNQG